MADMSLIQGAITGLKTATDIAKGFLELKTIAEVQGKVIDLQSAILSAQSSALAAQSQQSSMVDEIRALKEEITHIKAWEAQKQRYKLHTPWGGALVYALKKTMNEGEPAHWICTHCYEDGRRSILQYNQPKDGPHCYWCSACKAKVHFPFMDLPQGAVPYAPE